MARTTTTKPTRSTPVKRAWRSLTWLGVIIGRSHRHPRSRCRVPRRILDAEARSRPRGRHADHPRRRSSRAGRSSRRSNSTRRSRSSGSASTPPASPRPRSPRRATRTSSSRSPASPTSRRSRASSRRPSSSSARSSSRMSPRRAPSDSSSDPTAPPTEAPPTPEATQSLSTTPTAEPTDASDPNWVTPALYQEYLDFDCASVEANAANVAPADEPLITCDTAARVQVHPRPGRGLAARTSPTRSSGLSAQLAGREHRPVGRHHHLRR